MLGFCIGHQLLCMCSGMGCSSRVWGMGSSCRMESGCMVEVGLLKLYKRHTHTHTQAGYLVDSTLLHCIGFGVHAAGLSLDCRQPSAAVIACMRKH